MGPDPAVYPAEDNIEITRIAHSLLRMVLAVRYRKNLVIAVMAAAALLGGLYYITATRFYSSNAVLLVTQSGHDRLDTSITNEESLRQNTMPTFENMIRSAKVLEGAVRNLVPEDRIDLAGQPQENWIKVLQGNLVVKAIRSTSILNVGYRSKDSRVAANVVRAVVQSYLDFMDRMHKGTAGEISRMLTHERNELAEKLSRKQQELLEARRQFADMGFRSEGKTLHPMVQRAVFFNDALVATQKQRVEYEASLASLQAAVRNGEDLGQYMMSIADVVGRELLLNSLGLGSRDSNTQASLEQSLLFARAEYQTLQQNLGPTHPEVVSLAEKIRVTEAFLQANQDRVNQRVMDLRKSQLGPWLVQIVRQKLEEARKKEQILQTKFEETRTEAINLSGQLAQIELLERDVKRLGDMNDVLLNQIASLDLKQNGQEVRVAVIEEPVVMETPASPRLRNLALLTIVGGFGIALGLVTLLDALDDRFRSVEEMQSRLGVPLLSMIQRLQTATDGGVEALPTYATPTATESEGFRTLRTALMLTHQDARQIVISSAEVGDGKSTVAANLAVCYAQAEKKTLLIDADLRRPGLTAMMNMRGPHGLSEVLRSDGDIAQAAASNLRTTALRGLDIIPSGPRPTDPAELLGSPRFSQLLAWAESVYDQILIDSPPTLATADAAVIGRLVDGVVIVVQPAKNKRRLVTRMVERLGLLKIPTLGIIVNRVGSEDDQAYYGYRSYGYHSYGDGYNYHNAAEEGHEERQAAADGGAAAEPCVPFTEKRVDGCSEEDEPRSFIVPRRVA